MRLEGALHTGHCSAYQWQPNWRERLTILFGRPIWLRFSWGAPEARMSVGVDGPVEPAVLGRDEMKAVLP